MDNPTPGDPLTLYTAATDHSLQNFDVTALPDGRFAVAWLERDQDEITQTIKLSRFDNTGTPIDDPQTVFEYVYGSISLSNR